MWHPFMVLLMANGLDEGPGDVPGCAFDGCDDGPFLVMTSFHDVIDG